MSRHVCMYSFMQWICSSLGGHPRRLLELKSPHGRPENLTGSGRGHRRRRRRPSPLAVANRRSVLAAAVSPIA